MGNCRSSPPPSETGRSGGSQVASHRSVLSSEGAVPSPLSPSVPDASTSAVVHSFFAIAQPIIRRVLTKRLMEEVGLLRYEEPVESYDDFCCDADLPIKPLLINFGSVHVVDPATLRADMEAVPKFDWPEREAAEELMTHCSEQGTVGMVVLDLIDFDGELRFDKGVEIAVPVKAPLGTEVELEIGYGGNIEAARFRVQVPKLRLWYINKSHTLHIAFMERPDFVPHINVNVDRGHGDFLSVSFTEHGALDDVVEQILSGFGPNIKKRTNRRASLVGNKVGDLVVLALDKYKNMGNGRPLCVPLRAAVEKGISIALGEPRPVEEIEADMKRLEIELEISRRLHQSDPSGETKEELHRPAMVEEKKHHGNISAHSGSALRNILCFDTTAWSSKG